MRRGAPVYIHVKDLQPAADLLVNLISPNDFSPRRDIAERFAEQVRQGERIYENSARFDGLRKVLGALLQRVAR